MTIFMVHNSGHMDTVLSISKAKGRLLDLLRRAKEEGAIFTLTKRGEPEGVIMSYDAYESLRETLEILSDPALLKKIRKGLKEYEADELVSYDEVFS